MSRGRDQETNLKHLYGRLGAVHARSAAWFLCFPQAITGFDIDNKPKRRIASEYVFPEWVLRFIVSRSYGSSDRGTEIIVFSEGRLLPGSAAISNLSLSL